MHNAMRQTVCITPRDDMNVDDYDSTNAMANIIPSVGRRRSQRVCDVPVFSRVPPSPASVEVGLVLGSMGPDGRWLLVALADLDDRLVRCVTGRRRGVKSKGLLRSVYSVCGVEQIVSFPQRRS
jgi:hypothetical protein